jgi:DNA-binding XRE family transcriptional regulator
MPMKIGETNYTTFEDLWNDSILTPAEKADIQLKVELMGKLIEAREKRGLTQKALADLCGVKQPFIARMEKGDTDPQVTTLLKILQPLGYTLAIVPASEANQSNRQ